MAVTMSWGKCSITIGKTGASDAMAITLATIGTIKDKSTNLEMQEGESKEARATGGVLIAYEEAEPTIQLTARVVEPDYAVIASILGTGATHDTVAGTLTYKTFVITDPFSVQVTPNAVGATGIKIRKARVTYKEGYSEDEGYYADFTFTVLACADGELFQKFKKTA